VTHINDIIEEWHGSAYAAICVRYLCIYICDAYEYYHL